MDTPPINQSGVGYILGRFSEDMGGNCSFSQSFVPNANVPGQTKDVLALSLELGFDRRDVNGLYRYISFSDFIFSSSKLYEISILRIFLCSFSNNFFLLTHYIWYELTISSFTILPIIINIVIVSLKFRVWHQQRFRQIVF